MANQLNINRQINTQEDMDNFREDVLRHYRSNKRDLLKYQREYKNLLDAKVFSTEDSNLRRSLLKNIEQLRKEKEELEAKLMVALAPTHKREYERHLILVACHVICQEKLNEDSKRLRSEIQDLEKQNLRVDKQIYELNRQTIPDSQHYAYVMKTRKKLFMLENQLEMNRKREGKYYTENYRLRRMIIDLLYERALFNKLWRRMINHLNSDKKYLVDIVEFAMGTFESSIQIYQRLQAMSKKSGREMDLRKLEMQNILRQITADSVNNQFLTLKGQTRELADLEPREYKRREIFRAFHRKKVSVYNRILQKILSFSGCQYVESAIEKFQKQESLYYSYFNYANELNYQITILNEGINELYREITFFRESNSQKIEMETEALSDLRTQLITEEATTKLKSEKKEKVDQKLEDLFQLIYNNIFKAVHCDDAPLMFFLGDHSKITIFNIEKFLKILEERLNKIISYVFISQRKERRRPDQLTVKDVSRKLEDPADIDNIILAQQCAECAEGEEVNPYDEEFVLPLSKDEVKLKLREKVIAPEMQYRLHSINECRLPRSRLLANKKF